MMKLDLSNSGISEKEILKYKKEVLKAHTNLHEKQGAGSDFLGWVNLKLDVQELEKIKVAASKIRKQSDVLIVIGIGGSYLGSKLFSKSTPKPNLPFVERSLMCPLLDTTL